jgi:hypothetical protein
MFLSDIRPQHFISVKKKGDFPLRVFFPTHKKINESADEAKKRKGGRQ